jgi:hypothetical protein
VVVRPLSPDRLCEALDGRHLRASGRDWRVEVYGVFDDHGRRWVQLALDGDQIRVVTLSLAPTHGPRHAVRSLRSWLDNPRATETVVEHL